MPRPRLAPQVLNNTSAPTRSGVDVRRMGSSRPLALLQTTTAREGLMGADAHPYVKVQGKEAKALFASKYVPMDDGTDVLKSAPGKVISQRGYGIRPCKYPVAVPKDPRIGFDNTLVDTTSGGFKVSKAGIIHHPQNAVLTDFHKGVLAGYDPASQPMWADGTYEETVANMRKEHSGLPETITFLPPPNARQDMFNVQALVGAQVYGDTLLRQEINKQFAEQRGEDIKAVLRKQGLSGQALEDATRAVEAGKARQEVARAVGLPPDAPEVSEIVRILPRRRMGVLDYFNQPGAGLGEGVNPFDMFPAVEPARPGRAPSPPRRGGDPFADLVDAELRRPMALPAPQRPAIEGGMARPAPHRDAGALVPMPMPMPPRPTGGGGRGGAGGGILNRIGNLGGDILSMLQRGGGDAGGGIDPFAERVPLLPAPPQAPRLMGPAGGGGGGRGKELVAKGKGNKK